MRNMKKDWYLISLILLAFIVSIISYRYLPDQVATHWGTNNQPDDYSSKLTAVLIMPLMSIFLYVMFYVVPKIDPKKENYQKFQKSYVLIIRAIITFMFIMHLVVLGNGLGYDINVGLITPIGVGLLFMLLGNYMPRFQHNYFIGIRTPWTLANEEVWRKTHQFTAKLFVIGGGIMVLASFLPDPYNFIIFLVATFGAALGGILSSYLFFNQLGK